MGKRLIWLVIVFIVIFGGLFGSKFYQMHEKSKIKRQMPAMTIAASRVVEENWQQFIPSIGSLVADSGIYVANEVAGTVSAIHFKSGQVVEKGQLLIELDMSTDNAELSGMKASRQLAQIQLDRLAKLLTKKSISKGSYDESKTLLDKAIADVDGKIADINKKKIRASFSGDLGIRLVDEGQYLAIGSPIVSLQKLNPIHVDFSIPERYLSDLYKTQQVTLKVQAYTDEVFGGQVTAYNPDVDVHSRSLKVRATLNNAEGRLKPGMFAEVNLLASVNKALRTLPDTAISYNPYGNYVFLIVNNDDKLTVQRKQITVGTSLKGRVEIIAGLELGDQVVSAGQNKLRNGMAITIAAKPAPSERTTVQDSSAVEVGP